MSMGSETDFTIPSPFTLEETYELSDAILQEDLQEIKKELGDVLLHLVFYSKIGSEKAVLILQMLSILSMKTYFPSPSYLWRYGGKR
jgi:XTP/dITP diphosphohydrolase